MVRRLVITQTRLGSVVETVANTVVGYLVNFVANLLILPLFGFNVSLAQNAVLGLLYTGISIIRGYLLRRAFNQIKGLHK
jgi:hypothetical protein